MSNVCHIITGLGDGGAEASLYRLCRAEQSFEHQVISLTDGGIYARRLCSLGVDVVQLGMPRGRMTPSGLWELQRALRRRRQDAIQTWMYHANLLGGVAARLLGHRNINWGIHHADLGQNGTSRNTVAVAKLGALLSHQIPRNIVCCASKAAENHFAFGYSRSKLVVIPNGYDLDAFRPDDIAGETLRKSLGLIAGRSVIGFVARHDVLKDHDNLFAALAELNSRGCSPTCLLVGSGMDRGNEEISASLSRHGLDGQVRLLGRRDDIPAVMNALDLHVLSSASEAFPNVLGEAMAAGTPCVSTDVGDAAEIIGDTGWIVPPKNPSALAAAIEAALTSHKDDGWSRRRYDARARISRKFSIGRMVTSYRRLWFPNTSPETTESA